MDFLFWFAVATPLLRFDADGAFLARLKAGDRAAVRLLVERHHGALVTLAGTVVKSRAAAEDVAQETWLAVMAGIGAFDGRSALSTWVVAILLNKARTHARREGRYVPFADEAARDAEPGPEPGLFRADGHWADPPPSFDGLDPERIVAGRELWRHVRAAIERLPPAQRAVLVMRDVEGKSGAETCHLLGLSPENQRILLHRARRRLRAEVAALTAAGRNVGLAQA
ncbi:MAG TPA: sigma-70 family RNA polymerase sigma factor [Methylomirabilota bacterium]|nr:sigma-70 family RNA polymerase sigma factor [Methylomirabilota bacterium]